MKRINVHEAKTHLSRYLEHVERGESFLVCRRNAPVAELRPVRRERTKARPMGLAKGRLRIPPAFFKPLPRDLLDAFEGKGRGGSYSIRSRSSGWWRNPTRWA